MSYYIDTYATQTLFITDEERWKLFRRWDENREDKTYFRYHSLSLRQMYYLTQLPINLPSDFYAVMEQMLLEDISDEKEKQDVVEYLDKFRGCFDKEVDLTNCFYVQSVTEVVREYLGIPASKPRRDTDSEPKSSMDWIV